MARVEQSIDCDVPVRTAYNQWTQFEEFPHFMEHVKEINQFGDKSLRWHTKHLWKEEEWEVEITEQIPDKRIAWCSRDGKQNAGVVTFHYLDDSKCRVMLQMDYSPEDLMENIGDKLGFFKRQVKTDLDSFKSFIESRGAETGAWRGEINHDQPGGENRKDH